jgi:murein DD-endopeptidase MepM/ murein hydrolase activator NlpD
MRKAGWLLFLALPMTSAVAEPSNQESALFDRLDVREQILDGQRAAAEKTTRARALLAYRLAQQQHLQFASSPEARLANASALDLALVTLRRSYDETTTLGYELNRVRLEHNALETALVGRALAQDAGNGDSPGRKDAAKGEPRLVKPLRGIPVAGPGTRRDGSSKVELHHDSVEILARLNEPVRAIAAGVVKRVELLPQGGFAVMLAHPSGKTSIVTGMRDIAVKLGDLVDAGQTLGLAGRNLDGAAVVSIEIWHNRQAQDAAKLLHIRVGPSS